MKKFVSLILIVLLAVGALFALTACSTQKIESEEDWNKAIEDTTKALQEGSLTITATTTAKSESHEDDYNTDSTGTQNVTAKHVVDADNLTAYSKIKAVSKEKSTSDNGDYTEKTTTVEEEYIEVVGKEIISYVREQDDTSKTGWHIEEYGGRKEYSSEEAAKAAFRAQISSMMAMVSSVLQFKYEDFKLDGGKYVHEDKQEEKDTDYNYYLKRTTSLKFADGKISYIGTDVEQSMSDKGESGSGTQESVVKISYKGSVKIPSSVAKLKDVKQPE